jgi:ABC-type uncharacterized transport system auxiliary subunit
MNRIYRFLGLGFMCMAVVLITGCFARSKPPYAMEHYALEYASPTIQGLDALPASVKVTRFSVTQAYNSRAMIYKSDSYRLGSYNYQRWRVNPGDMVTDYLLRDLRNAAIFPAVFSHRDAESARFVVEGEVDEFLHLIEKKGAAVLLSLYVTLLDERQKEITKRILFQKRYRVTESTPDDTPEAFAKAMSVALSRLSEALIKDVHAAATRRLEGAL